MPTITQMVYLENYTRHLTEIRHQAPQTPPPTSADLRAPFHADRRRDKGALCCCSQQRGDSRGVGGVDTEQHAKE